MALVDLVDAIVDKWRTTGLEIDRKVTNDFDNAPFYIIFHFVRTNILTRIYMRVRWRNVYVE